MEKLTEILIYLFILSIITEKLVSIVRRFPIQFQIIVILISTYLSCVSVNSISVNGFGWIYFLTIIVSVVIFIISFSSTLVFFGVQLPFKFLNLINLLNPFKNIKKGSVGVKKSSKDKEITLLSFTIGFIIALLFNSNLFDFFNTNLSDISPLNFNAIFNKWNLFNPNYDPNFVKFLGIVATGFFLSFGSKFFHELLDLLFQIRSLRKKKNFEGTYNAESIKELDEILKINYEDIVEIVFEREKDNIFKVPGVNGYSISNFIWNNRKERGIKILSTKPSLVRLEQFQYKMPGETNYQVPVKVIKANIAEACSSIYPSAKISNKNMDNYGTLCIPVFDDEKNIYFLSCFHVVKHEYHSWKQFRTNGYEEIKLNNGEIIGKISDVRFNNLMDAALIKKTDNIKKSEIHTKIGNTTIKTVKDITNNDINNIVVKMKGATTSFEKEGYIVGRNSKQKIKYSGRESVQEITNLIELTDTSFEKPLVSKGDSGALIYDTKGNAIAMVVATDGIQSYAIPINTILNEFNVKIYK